MDPFNFGDPISYSEIMKTHGNQDFRNGNYSLAIKKYDTAMHALLFSQQTRGISHHREIAVLMCNRSNAFYNLNKWKEAFYSAQDSLNWDPTYVKGYYRAGYSLIKWSQNSDKVSSCDEAARMFCAGLKVLGMSSDVGQVSDFIVGVFSCVNNEKTISLQFVSICKQLVNDYYSLSVWQQVIEKLARKGFWQSCLLLSSEKNRLPEKLRVTHLSLKDLFETYVIFGQYEKMERIPKLVEWLISIGADIGSIGAYPLHAVIILCIKAKGNHLFRWLLDHKPELKELINQQNEDGSTVLHVVASHSNGYSIKNQIEDVVMLLKAGVNPQICDAQSRSAVDILKTHKKFKAVDIINKHISQHVPSPEESPGPTENETPEDAAALLQNAFEQFSQFCCVENGARSIESLMHKSIKGLLRLLHTVKEIPSEIACDVPPACASSFIKLLLEKKMWHEVLLLLTQTATGEMPPGDRLLPNCDLSDLDIGTVLNHLDIQNKLREQLIKSLIDRGASPEGTGTSPERPLQKCLKKNDFALACLLLKSGADPCFLSITDGDTPLHAALCICSDKKDGKGIDILKYLLDLYVSSPSIYPYLHPNHQDKNGNTVMHIIFQKNPTKEIKKVLGLLAKFDINFNIRNNAGRDVRHKKKKNEPIVLAWNEALADNKKKYRHDPAGQPSKLSKLITACNKLQPTNSSHDSTEHSSQSSNGDQPIGKSPEASTDSDKQEEAGDAEEKDSAFRCLDKPLTLQDGLVQGIAQLIQKLVLGEVSPKMNSVTSEATKPLSTVSDSADKENECQQTCSHEELAYDGKEDPFPDEDDSKNKAHDEAKGGEEAAAAEGDEPFQEFEVPGQDFDNMTWEIECTSETLKKLGSKSIHRYMKNKVIRIIQQLGNGEWTKGLQKQLKHLKGDIQLYEAKLDKGARMLWELAIDFSPRCSENAEKIIENDQSTHPMEKTGRVYTEIIRIWDIVLDHGKLNRTIEMICTAYNRGLSCILRKKLKGINGGLMSSSVKTQRRIPRIYVEDTKAQKSEDAVLPEYFPPASAVETEYNIMKFHSFSTNMALNIISDMSSTVEYPFRVGELEYAIIGLNPKPLEPIILIGRSGTGKTTCCLYRLWKNFHSYWEKAELAESPLLVRQVWHRLKFDMQLRNKSIQEEVHEEKQDSYTSIDSELDSSLSTDNEHEQEEASQCSSNLGDSEMNLVHDSDEEYTVEESDKLDHLHQIFITKNHVLCQEVQRNFTELSKSSKATSHFKPLEANVYKLQDVKDENFPLFLTSKQLLLLLDASMPEPFFLRNEDGSLKHTIDGWSTAEEMVISNWQEEEEDLDVEGDHDEDEKATEGHTRECDPRVFVTYNVFVNEIWPKMVKGKCPYSPALVWKEIKSFLKGSFEALSSHQGILTEEEYKKLGRKRCPNFKEDRSEIYQLFCHYQRIRSQGNYFDEEDVLHKLSQRLSKLTELPWCIHELYGDEIQDFTQAELVLLMKCINDPNAMFLTGDTAQSIIKGVAFRFSDLRSLFYYASKNSDDNKKQCIVRKPKRIYQLYQNYRSHSGILRLASGVVDLLQYFFPESFDRLPRDSGLFDGPKPTVLDSCSVSDLAILLRGNKRKTQPIEFGAHQVILVANEIAKEKIPEELNLALVLTIYEAKGLEFDDVLLYNFFTDSEAYKEWKIISSFVPPSHLPEENELIIETPFEKDVDPPGKHSTLNPEMYKMLNGELKQLYTAITRARVNLWIFDENRDRRAPAFQYFMNREYVQLVKTDENKDFDDSMFVKTSTPEEWVAQGDYYAKHQCWKVAAKCYQKGGATEKEKLALANDAVLQVKSKKISPKEKQMEYLNLAKTYLECGEPNLALKCLIHAKEYKLCAQLCEKLGKVKDAALFYKRGQCYIDAARCFEQIQEFDLAIRMYCQDEQYEEAAMTVERIEKIQRSKQLSPRLSYTANQFYLEAAAKYLRANKISEMMKALSHLDTEDQLVFLKAHKHFSEAADLLKRENRDEEAAQLMKQHGFVLEAAKLTNQMDFRALCLLAAARLSRTGFYQLKNLTAILEEALELSEQTKQKSVNAEATYLLGVLKKDFHTLEKAFWMFLEVNHNAGAVEAVFEATRCEEKSEAILKLASCGIDVLLKLVKAFRKAGTNAEKEMVKSCFEYFAIVQVDEKFCQVSQKEAGCILKFSTENPSPREKKTSDQFIVSLEEMKTVLTKHLLSRLSAIAQRLIDLSFPNMCMRFIAGLQCENETCEDFHRVLLFQEIKSIIQCKMHLAAINKLLLEGKQMFPKEMLHEPNAIDTLLTADKYALCKSLINAIFPKHFHLRMVSKSPASCKHTLSLHRHDCLISNSCRMVLKEYIESEFKNETAQNRRESTDLWLRAMQILALTSHYPEVFERFLLKEEDEYNRALKTMEERGRGRSKGVEGRYGMLVPDKYAGNAESSHLCFIRLLQESMDQLYVHRNPEKCKWLFYRFMNVLVKKCIDPLIPSIGNTVTLLEFQFILGCAVLMRLCRSMTLCLPKSYIALFHFWDFLFARKERHREIFSIIQDYKPEDTRQAVRKFKFHLRYLADVLCNYENFTVLLDAFDDPDCIVSGEAERTVVLCLVMLVNADQVLHWKYKSILAHHFPILKKKLMKMKKKCPSQVPERLLHIVDVMSETSDVKKVVEGLKELLFKRDEEFLADCCWRWDPKAPWSTRHEENKVIRGIYYKVADLDRFAYSSGEMEYFEEPETDLEKDIYVEEREDPLANIASIRQQKQQQKASARRKLQRLFQFVRCLVRWKRIACTKPESSEMTPGIFKRADIDQTQCDLCGVKFLPNPSNFSSRTEPAEMTTPTETDWEDGEIIATGETFESHVSLDEHKKKSTSYQKYCEFFKNTVEPVIHEGMNVIERIMQNTHIKGHFATNEQSSVEQSKIQDAIQKISDSVEDIYKRKAWADAEETLSKLAKNLNSTLDNGIKWLEKAETYLLKKEEFDDDKDLDNEVKGEEVTFDELHPKKPLRKKRKCKK